MSEIDQIIKALVDFSDVRDLSFNNSSKTIIQ